MNTNQLLLFGAVFALMLFFAGTSGLSTVGSPSASPTSPYFIAGLGFIGVLAFLALRRGRRR